MRVYIVRHAEANREAGSGRDEDRELTPLGHRQAKFLGTRLARCAPPPDLVLVSPLMRAMQTAELMNADLGVPMRTEPTLATGYAASDALDLIARHVAHDGRGPLLMVGHNPQLEIALGVLTIGVAGAHCSLRTGEAVCVDFDNFQNPIGAAKASERIRLE